MIYNKLSIKDLENLTGVKAHTIRIWEKRYSLLSPERTDTNIRFYSISALQKMLNVKLLQENGWKISKIAKLSEDEILREVAQCTQVVEDNLSAYVDRILLSMLSYDKKEFFHVYDELSSKLDFSQIYFDVVVPFFHKVGLMWQTSSITAAHEHFITNLILQKIHVEIDSIEKESAQSGDILFVLFLPEYEIHQLKLLYLYYVLLKKGCNVIYLGESVPLDAFESFQKLPKPIRYVSSFTTFPVADNLASYLTEFSEKVLVSSKDEFLIIDDHHTDQDFNGKIKFCRTVEQIVNF
ncbi:MerR family transcriptional regulator [Aureibacter tunicatorum]|nr:MerR family transcriptional regulator [Aureibacter tunicatorum]